MCGCKKHDDDEAICTCICPEHGNFQMAYELAMSRFDEIRRLEAQIERIRVAVQEHPNTDPGLVEAVSAALNGA